MFRSGMMELQLLAPIAFCFAFYLWAKWSFWFGDQLFIEGRGGSLFDQRMVEGSLEEGITEVFKLG